MLTPWTDLKKKRFFEKSTPYETVANATESTQNLSPGRFWHAEVEFDVKNLRIRHPDLEIKKNDLYFFLFNPFAGLLSESSIFPSLAEVAREH